MSRKLSRNTTVPPKIGRQHQLPRTIEDYKPFEVESHRKLLENKDIWIMGGKPHVNVAIVINWSKAQKGIQEAWMRPGWPRLSTAIFATGMT